MMYFITNSKLLCEIKESSVGAIKKNHENSFCDHFIYIRFYNWMCVLVTHLQWSFETYWGVRLYCQGLNVDGNIYIYMCFLKYYIVIIHNNVECDNDGDIVVNHVFTVCENFIKDVIKVYLIFFV